MAPETFAPPVFVISNTHGSIIKFQVIFDSDEVDRNIDVHFNLIAPACWEMNTTQDNHKIVRTSVPYKIGASGKSVGLRVELKPAAVEVDGRLEVLPVAESAC